MAAEDLNRDVTLVERIASVEEKMKEICDLIPISTWGFSADVNEKLRQRKHRIVNQHLTTKEKLMLSNSKKQQVARTVGSVCRRVSEVFELLSANPEKDSRPKKVVLPVMMSKKVENKEQMEKEKVTSKSSVNATSHSDFDDAEENGHSQISLLKTFAKSRNSEVPSTANSGENFKTCSAVDAFGVGIGNKSREETRKRFGDELTEVQPKKQQLSEVQCETKEDSPDILKQREFALRKLQEKLKAMKASRGGKSKATKDLSAVSKLEEERKLKRRISKIKMKQRRAKERQPNVDKGSEIRAELEGKKSKHETVSFSKFDFIVKHESKKRRLTTSEKKQKFSGKDYRSLIKKVEKREEKLEKLRDKEPQKAVEVEDSIKWNRALNKAQGIKVKDNMELLQKGLKRKEKLKDKRKENWSNREAALERGKMKKQEKREENIRKRIDDKKKRKMKLMKKKGRII